MKQWKTSAFFRYDHTANLMGGHFLAGAVLKKKTSRATHKKNKNYSDQVYSHIWFKNVRQASRTNLQTHQNDATRHQQNIQLIKQITTIKTNEMETRPEKICSARMEWTNISNRFKTQFARQFIALIAQRIVWHGMVWHTACCGVAWRGGMKCDWNITRLFRRFGWISSAD